MPMAAATEVAYADSIESWTMIVLTVKQTS